MNNNELSSSKWKKRARFNMNRRTFLKLSAFAGAAVAALRIIKHPIISSAVPLQESGENTINEKWIVTSCLNCSTRCATRVRVADGRAVKITGNPLSQVSEGENCPRAHIGLQVLYDPGWINSPLASVTVKPT